MLLPKTQKNKIGRPNFCLDGPKFFWTAKKKMGGPPQNWATKTFFWTAKKNSEGQNIFGPRGFWTANKLLAVQKQKISMLLPRTRQSEKILYICTSSAPKTTWKRSPVWWWWW